MPEVYAIDGVVPVVAPSAFVHPTAVLTEPTGARLEIIPTAIDHDRWPILRDAPFRRSSG